MVRTRSSSGSRSSSPKERLDRFGRVIPPGKRSRSRSSSRDRDRYRRMRSRSPHRRYHGGRSRSRSNRGSRSRSRSHSRSRSGRPYSRYPDRPDPRRNQTNIEDPDLLKARIFIGHLPSDRVNKEELEALFASYGKILGVSIHDRGYGFIQFEKEEDALKAKEAENGTKLKGSVLDVKMAVEGRRQPGAGRGRDPMGRGGGPPGRDFDRDPGYPPRDGRGPPPGRERSPLRGDPYDDRYRDPYARREPLPPRDPYADPYRRGPPPPPPIDDPYRDPYREDPYRRDPYRREPFDDPYRDPYYRDPYLPPPPPKKPMPADVQIICMNKQLQMYAESIESRLRQHALITDIIVIPEEMKVPQMVEEAARLKFLFAIIINSQNEVHKSLTLNILHGTPQEHRNMPMEDSIKLVASSFEKYIQTQREKAAPPPAAPPAAAPVAPTPGPSGGPPPPFVPPSADISYLLNLLADNRQLTVEELEKVIGYLRERKDKLLIAEGRAAPDAGPRPAPPTAAAEPPISSGYLQQQQQELQNKILNILNGSGTGAGAAVQAPPQAAQAPTMSAYGGAGGGSVMSTGRPQSSATPGGAKPVINFDNPNLQKALDNLIQSGPNLLKSLPSTAVQPAPARPSGYQSMGQQGPPARTALSSYPQQQTSPQQQPPQQGYGGQYQQYQQPMGGAQNQQRPMSGYSAGQGGPQRPLMSTRAPQQGVRPRY